jgi:hypothetical protein
MRPVSGAIFFGGLAIGHCNQNSIATLGFVIEKSCRWVAWHKRTTVCNKAKDLSISDLCLVCLSQRMSDNDKDVDNMCFNAVFASRVPVGP